MVIKVLCSTTHLHKSAVTDSGLYGGTVCSKAALMDES